MDVQVFTKQIKKWINELDKVWSVTIAGKNDCVVMTEFEAMQVKLKFSGDDAQFEMYDMTERHGMKPEHLHKLQRMTDAERFGPSVTVLEESKYTKGVGPGAFGGACHKQLWEYDDLMAM